MFFYDGMGIFQGDDTRIYPAKIVNRWFGSMHIIFTYCPQQSPNFNATKNYWDVPEKALHKSTFPIINTRPWYYSMQLEMICYDFMINVFLNLS